MAGFILDAYQAGEVGLDLCTIDIDLAFSRRQAPALWEELLILGPEERFLCRKSEEEAAREPGQAIQIAALALKVAMLLTDWEPAEDNWLCLIRGYAWAHLANALRAAGKFRIKTTLKKRVEVGFFKGRLSINLRRVCGLSKRLRSSDFLRLEC